ncbi:bestrophin-like domain [Streptomyces virginiae]
MVITVIAVVTLALIAGLAANRFLRGRMLGEDATGLSVSDLAAPVTMLTIVILAFTLVSASSSYGKAGEAARLEAGAMEHTYQVIEYAPSKQRQRLKADIVCYARAVRSLEWPAMAKSHSSDVPSAWSADLHTTLMETRGDFPSFGPLVTTNNERSLARLTRLAESGTSVPPPIMYFLVGTLAVTVMTLAFLLPKKKKRVEATVLLVLTALFLGTLVIIQDAQYPFSGAIKLEPTAINRVEDVLTQDFQADYGPGRLPCDSKGRSARPLNRSLQAPPGR